MRTRAKQIKANGERMRQGSTRLDIVLLPSHSKVKSSFAAAEALMDAFEASSLSTQRLALGNSKAT